MKNELMTIDEAIQHCKDVITKVGCNECGMQHRQLIEWLEELKSYREREVNK